MLQQAYHDLYTNHFSLKKGGEPLEKWIENIGNAKNDTRYIIPIFGENLNNPDAKKRTIFGISVGLYFPRSDTGLMSYNLVAPSARGKGVGKQMFLTRLQAMLTEAQGQGKILRGTFAECNNPQIVKTENDLIDPKKRIAIYKKLGGKILPFDYIYPLASDPRKKLRNMVLLGFKHPLNNRHPDRHVIKDFLWDSYIEADVPAPGHDPDFTAMMLSLEPNDRG